MNLIHRTPTGGLIGNLAYNNASFISKLIFLFLGGELTFLREIYKGNYAEAFFSPASNMYSIGTTAYAKIKTSNNKAVKTVWAILGAVASFQALMFGIMAYYGLKHWGWTTKPQYYAVASAHALTLWRFPFLASRIAQEGLERYPENVFLQLSLTAALIRNSSSRISESLQDLASYYENADPDTKLRIARIMIKGFRFLGEQQKAREWYQLQEKIKGREYSRDQDLKFESETLM